mmetsp:Transcript_27347/g.24232  ORF Transcript_27347/g.24232 Transcript_27347/m.24232 type:complete len:84 (+) Transcript_27347:645-896(+)
MVKYIKTQSNIRHMNDLNAEVEEVILKSPEKAISQFKDYLHALNDSNPKEDVDLDFNEFNYEQKAQNEEVHQDFDGRGDKYAM